MKYTQQQPPLTTIITIKSITPSDKVPVFNVETMEGEKYQFWKTKSDGTDTMAYTQFMEKRFIGGDRLEIFYQEREGKPYINKYTNKEVTPINRIITKFVLDGEGSPKKVFTPSTPQNAPVASNLPSGEIIAELKAINERIDKMGNVFKGMSMEIESLKKKIHRLENPISEELLKMAEALGMSDKNIPII